MAVVIETTLGDITVDLFLKERPNTCLNFLKLCKVKYYNFCVFYKVERNFIAQTGDPTSTGRGGESIFSRIYGDQATYFEAELKPRLKHEKLGTLSMVNNGNGMNGSQFFITLSENLTYLDEVHTVFGEVTEGFDILLKINEAICDPNNRPYQDILITHTVVLHDPYDDHGLEIPNASPLPSKEQLESNYIGADEDIDDTKGKTAEEVEEKIKESEAKARATILEMVGDIPDADVKPPETVLFVCKLNPVTSSEDLEIIFSRFGLIKSCEVIKDKKTGESLQYAFIEFEKEEDCENAYFKMDNVLIDDRRIHVDFSQSVSKMFLEKGNKFSKNKNSKDMFVIKNKVKKSDGYDMIFDMDDDSTQSKHKKLDKRSPDQKYKRRDFPQKSNERTRKRSHSTERRPNECMKSSRSYHSRDYDRPKSNKNNAHRRSDDYRKDNNKSTPPPKDYKGTSISTHKEDKYTSRNCYYSSDESSATNCKIRIDYHKKRHHSSSSSHSVSPLKNSTVRSAGKHQKSKILDIHSYTSKERKNDSSRHKSSSSESDVPRHQSKIRTYSQSPELSSRRTNKSKKASPERSRSHQKQKKHLSRNQSNSPESYNYKTNHKKIAKSRRHRSRSFNSQSPDRKKQFDRSHRHRSRSLNSQSPDRKKQFDRSHRHHSRSFNSQSPDRKKQFDRSHRYRSRSLNSQSPDKKKQFDRSQSRSPSPKKYAHDSKTKSSFAKKEKVSKCSKKSKKNKKRTRSSSSSSYSDSDSSVQKIKNKDHSSHSRTHKDYKHRR